MAKKIDWEERRFWSAALILSGMASNYHNGMYPSDSRVKDAVYYADLLIKELCNSENNQ